MDAQQDAEQDEMPEAQPPGDEMPMGAMADATPSEDTAMPSGGMSLDGELAAAGSVEGSAAGPGGMPTGSMTDAAASGAASAPGVVEIPGLWRLTLTPEPGTEK
ncbi:hypothetical protein [Microbacterium sp. SLBN-146]|uniref:hypothetical protein n=1 Tax=Microbacterium sp. SLBN-146 TaxID=2768457 RepID=UPI00114E0CE6|nr:hypothetical protein [Microbacterium sp. SLBN-146]TQJ31154.1 hypothetical protein FBY39_1616 [Microbacterium sp. SLBN-146]